MNEVIAEKPRETMIEKPVQTIAEKAVETIAEKPMETIAEKPMETTIEKPMETIAEKPMETTIEKPMETIAEKPMETIAEKPMETTIEKPKPMETIAQQTVTDHAIRMKPEMPAISTTHPPVNSISTSMQVGFPPATPESSVHDSVNDERFPSLPAARPPPTVSFSEPVVQPNSSGFPASMMSNPADRSVDTNQIIAMALQVLAESSAGGTIPPQFSVPVSVSAPPQMNHATAAMLLRQLQSRGTVSTPSDTHTRSSNRITAAHVCGMCETAQATLNCLHCREMYCNSCNMALHGQGRFKQHTVVVLGATLPVQQMVRLGVCAQHGENINFYDLDDDSLVCAHCLLIGNHVGHRSQTLGVAADGKQTILKDFFAKLNRRASDIDAVSELLVEQSARVTAASRMIQEDVQYKMMQLKHVIEQREESLLQAIRAEEGEKLRDIASKMAELKSESLRVHGVMKECEDILGTSDVYQFFQEFDARGRSLLALPLGEEKVEVPLVSTEFCCKTIDVDSHVVHLSRLDFDAVVQQRKPVFVLEFVLKRESAEDVQQLERAVRAELLHSPLSTSMTLGSSHILKSETAVKLRYYFDTTEAFTSGLEGHFLHLPRGIREGLSNYVESVGSIYFGNKVDIFGRH